MVVDGSHGQNGFEDACRAKCVAIITFQRIHRDILQSCPLDGNRLHLVVKQGGGAMGIDKGKFRDIAFTGDGIDGQPRTFSVLRRGADVKGIIPDCTAFHYPAIGLRLARENDGGCGFSEIEAKALDVEGPAFVCRNGLQ